MAEYDVKTALLVVDTQNDFADPGGSLYVKGGEEVVPVANREIERALTAGALVVYTQDWHPQSTPHFQKDGGIWPVHCVQETWGAEFHPELTVKGDIIRKGTGGEDGYSSFTVRDPKTGVQEGTDLEPHLRAHGIEKIVMVGLATDYCVKETALDARRLGFDTTILLDGVRGVNLQPGDDERAVHDVMLAGARVE
ncbi:MAG TPA: isochorismatase family protein [Actinomycetota bacterium]|jgi:nicotinamidase/pyrazinamidase